MCSARSGEDEATYTARSQNCCGRSSMMPNESAREKTARREATVDRQKGFWMVGRADFFGADRYLFEIQLAEQIVATFIYASASVDRVRRR